MLRKIQLHNPKVAKVEDDHVIHKTHSEALEDNTIPYRSSNLNSKFEDYRLTQLCIEPVINVVSAQGVTFCTNIQLEEICQTGHSLEIIPIDNLTLQREFCNVSYFSETCRICLKDLSTDETNYISFFDEFGVVTAETGIICSELQAMNIEITREQGVPQQICIECYNAFAKICHFRKICERSRDVIDEISEFTSKQLQNEIKSENNIEYLNVKHSYEIIEIKEENEDFNETNDDETAVDQQEVQDEVSHDEDCQTSNNQQSYECNRCGSNFLDNRTFVDHQSYNVCVDSKYPKCRVCEREFPNVELLDRHLKNSHVSISCDKCSKVFSTLSKYTRHQRYHQSYICDFCSHICYTKRNMKDHLRMHVIGLYPCVFCDESFGSRKRLGLHKKSVHPNDLYKCPHCSKEFRLKDTYRCHLMKHNPDKPHKCTYCEKQFVFRHHLENHLRSHTKVNPFLCNFCGKTFRVEVGLRAHLAGHDPKMYPHRKRKCLPQKMRQCDKCNYSTNQSGNLKKHKIKHHSEGGDSSSPASKGHFEFICQICDKEFKVLTSLENHLHVHNEVRDFHCPHCKASFRKQTYLRLHIDGVHLKLRPNKCTKCDAAYLMSNDLKRHMMQKHSFDRPFQCYYCQKTFIIAQYLKNHINRVHTQEQKFEQ